MILILGWQESEGYRAESHIRVIERMATILGGATECDETSGRLVMSCTRWAERLVKIKIYTNDFLFEFYRFIYYNAIVFFIS